MILSLVEEHGNDWKKIGVVLERFPLNVRDRWREINADYKHGPWTPEETERLKRLVEEVMGEGDVHTLTDIQWCGISHRLQTRSRNQCRGHWS